MSNDWKIGLKLSAFVIIAVWLVRAFLVTSCFIPSSGMENTLYQGEGVLVNKWSYGLRMPFPSFLGYHRIGNCDVGKGDIVIFNDPGATQRNKRLEWRSVFISRCIATPGDTLMLNRELINTGDEILSPDSKALYVYPASKEDLMKIILDAVGLKENSLVGYTEDGGYIRSFSHYELFGFTKSRTANRFCSAKQQTFARDTSLCCSSQRGSCKSISVECSIVM